MADTNDITDEDLEAAFSAAFGGDDKEDGDGDGTAPDTDTADSDEDEGEEAPEGWVPPTYKELRALKAEKNEEAKKWRLRATGKDPDWKIPGMAATTDTTAAGGKTDEAELRKQIRAEIEGEYATRREQDMVQKEAVTALVTAGLQLPKDPEKRKKAVSGVIKLLSLDDVTVDGDDIVGLDDAIESLREDHPGLFAAAAVSESPVKRKARRVAPEPRGVVGEKDPLHQMAASYFGQ